MQYYSLVAETGAGSEGSEEDPLPGDLRGRRIRPQLSKHFSNSELARCILEARAQVMCRGVVMTAESIDSEPLLRRAAGGDNAALAELFDRHSPRLRQMVRLRLDRRLQGRVNPSDVLQDAYIDLVGQIPRYLSKPELPFFLWLRVLTSQRLMRVHRQHLGSAMRDAGREVSLYKGAMPQASSVSLAAHLLGRFASASEAAVRAERQVQLQVALNGMDELDREVIALRHFEELTNLEVSQVLGISKSAASNRYVRAMTRLQGILAAIPGLID